MRLPFRKDEYYTTKHPRAILVEERLQNIHTYFPMWVNIAAQAVVIVQRVAHFKMKFLGNSNLRHLCINLMT
jgi:hypothetical protein